MSHSPKARGFTLLEICIAMSVMLIVGLGAVSLFFYAVRYNSGATDRTNELAILQRQVETYRALQCDSAQMAAQAAATTLVTTQASSGTNANNTNSTAGDSRSYDLTTTIEDLTTYTGGPVMQKRITLTVKARNSNRSQNDWRNAAMTVVVRRTSPALGPYRQ